MSAPEPLHQCHPQPHPSYLSDNQTNSASADCHTKISVYSEPSEAQDAHHPGHMFGDVLHTVNPHQKDADKLQLPDARHPWAQLQMTAMAFALDASPALLPSP